jgi:hypothetical protein
MPRFYFHLRDDLDARDEEGMDLPDAEAARAYAVTNARDIMSGTLKSHGRISLAHRIDVEDEHGALVMAVIFGDAVDLEQ